MSSFPKGDAGFEIEYDAFSIGPQEEVTLHIGWAPQKHGNVRENVTFRFGNNGGQARVVLVGQCAEPREDKR